MGSPTKPPADPRELDGDALGIALYCIDSVLRFRSYTPGSMLVMLLGKFRDDLRDAHGNHTLLPAQRGSQHLPIGELDLSDLDTACDSAGTLLDQFEPFMDDPELPELLRDLGDILNAEKADRAALREAGTQAANAS
jgi:hypothetical protein